MFCPLTKRDKTKERKLTMDNMLGISLREVRGPLDDLNKKLCGGDGRKWFKALKHFLRGEPTWTEKGDYTPLEWTEDLGSPNITNIYDETKIYSRNNGGEWRIPTVDELFRHLGRKELGFVQFEHYWAKKQDGCLELLHINKEGCVQRSTAVQFLAFRSHYPVLRLCRPIKLPE